MIDSARPTPSYDGQDPSANGELPAALSFQLQTPEEFSTDFVAAVHAARRQVGLETMQFEVNEATQPVFDALTTAKDRGVDDVRFHYDRVALQHIRAGEGATASQAYVVLGHTALHRGDKVVLKQANVERTVLVKQLEESGITSPENKVRGNYKHLNHNHIKLAIADDVAWFGTMNLRGIDFEMSNFMVKVTDPYFVEALREIFDRTEDVRAKSDEIFTKPTRPGEPVTSLILDGGERGQSAIFDKALAMADSLETGDEFVMISQWPPVKMVLGEIAEKLEAKTKAGVTGTFLMSPPEALHPYRRASLALQKQVEKKQRANPHMRAVNLARQTHAKAFLIKRADGRQEVLFGSHNLSDRTVKNGTRELAMWSNDTEIVTQVSDFLVAVQSE